MILHIANEKVIVNEKVTVNEKMKPKQNNLFPPSEPESNNYLFVPSHLFSSKKGGKHGLPGKKSCELVSHRDGDE